jgi:hypothetical protein
VRQHSILIGSVLVSLCVLTSAQARAQQDTDMPGVKPPPANSPSGRFGHQGQFALSSDEGINTSYSAREGDDVFIYTLRPALDYFLIENVSLGVTAGLDYTSVGDEHASVYSIGPRVGYNIPFKSMFSIWPRVGVSYATTTTSSDFAEDDDDSHAQLNLSVPLMFHPLLHFFVGFGPALDADLSGDNKTTTIAGRVTIGGWF